MLLRLKESGMVRDRRLLLSLRLRDEKTSEGRRTKLLLRRSPVMMDLLLHLISSVRVVCGSGKLFIVLVSIGTSMLIVVTQGLFVE